MEENEDIDLSVQQPQLPYVYTSTGTSLAANLTNDTVEEFTDKIAHADFEILTAYSKKDILKKLKKFKENHKILNISLSTDTKYSKTFDKEYTEYTVLIQYL